MSDLILPRLPKSLQGIYIEYGRGLLLFMFGVLAVTVFIGMYELKADKVTRHVFLPVVKKEERTGNNLSPETVFTVTTPDGGTAQFATQSPAVLRDAGAQICAEELRAKNGRTHWEASPAKTCQQRASAPTF